MASVQWMEQNGKRILYADYTGATPEQMMANLETSKQILADVSGGLLLLVNFKGAMVDANFMQHLKIAGAEIIEPIMEKQAIIGVEGIRHILLQAYNIFTGAGNNQRVFDNEAEALEWLTS